MIAQQVSHPKRKAERRHERRDPVDTAVILFFSDTEGQEATVPGRLLDVSEHGARFRTAREVCTSSTVKFRHAGLGVGGWGVIRYCNWSPAGFDVGVEFQGGTGWRHPTGALSTSTVETAQ